MTELDLLKTEVHAKGFNVSMMINLFKKKQREMKAIHEVPDEVLCAVCRAYLTTTKQIDKSFPYFMTVLQRKSEEYCAANSQKYERFGRMPQSILEIMKGVK